MILKASFNQMILFVGRKFMFWGRILRFLALIENSILASSKPIWDRKEKAGLMEKSAVAVFLARIQLA